jgi:hypothetical protein
MVAKNVKMQMDKPNEQPANPIFTYGQLIGELKNKITMELKAHVSNILKYFIKDNTTTQHIIKFNKNIINVNNTINDYMNHLVP